MNPIENQHIDELIESATPDFIKICEQNEKIYREARQHEKPPVYGYSFTPGLSSVFTYVDDDGVVHEVVPMEVVRQMSAAWGSAQKHYFGEIAKANKLSRRFMWAAMIAGAGWLLTLCAWAWRLHR